MRKLEFIRFLKFSRRFASAVQSELYLAPDRKYINKEELPEKIFIAIDHLSDYQAIQLLN